MEGSESLRVGSTTVSVLGHRTDADLRSRSWEKILVFTGRPFLDDAPLQRGPSSTMVEAENLDGKFAGFVAHADELELFTDCIGAGSVYYAERDGFIYFSSHLGLLLIGLPWQPELNDVGVVGQLIARSQLRDETHFTGTFRLPAGRRLRVDRDGQSLLGSEAAWFESLLSLDVPRFAPDSFWEMMDAGVRREHYDRSSILMYSGGRDSTAIALARSEYPKLAATYGEEYSIDRLRGLRRARSLGLDSLAVPYDDWTLDIYSDVIVGLHAGCSGLQTTHNMVGFDWAADRANVASVGFLGDALTGAHSGPDCDPTDDYVLHILVPSHRAPLVAQMFEAETRAVEEHVMERFLSIERDRGRRQALMILDLQWRQARWISMMFDLCSWFLPVSYPFMQRRLLAACLQAPDEALQEQRDYDRALCQRLGRRKCWFPDPGSRFEQIWVRLRTEVAARRRGRRRVGRCDYPAVMARTAFELKDYRCGHARLDDLTRRSWMEWMQPDSRRSNIPVAFASAPIAAAVALTGSG